jgi:predicted DNA-binding transcriptional regulator AlpA
MNSQAIIPKSFSDDALLNIKDVSAITRMSRTWIYEAVAAGKLAAPIRLSARASRWRASDVRRFLASLQGEAQ